MESSFGAYFASKLAALSKPLLMNMTWLRSHSLVILFLIYSAAKRVFTILHDASSGTIVRAMYLLNCDVLKKEHERSGPQRVCILCAIRSVCASIVGAHCVGHGVLASLDATMQFIELVWKNSSTLLRHRRQRGTKPIGRRAIGILSILQVLTSGDFILTVWTGFVCLEKANRRECEQYTHKYSTCRVAQHQYNPSREHAWLKSWNAQDILIALKKQLSFTCHVSLALV